MIVNIFKQTQNLKKNLIRIDLKILNKKKNGGGNGNTSEPNTSKQQNETETFSNKIKNSTQIGYFIKNEKKLNAYIYLHHNNNSKFNNTPTLYISFKGSSNFKDFGHDLKSAVSKNIPLSQLGENGKPESNGKASSVFINILKDSISQLYDKVIKLIKPDKETNLNNSLKQQQISQQEIYNKNFFKKLNNLKLRIIITGHSLGGALAELFGYYLKKYKSTEITCPIHIITFGACCVFDAAGRNEFNLQLNISGPNVFTLDRITANADPIVLLPAHLDHGGYTLLKSSINELKAFTKTGRTNEIGEIRKMLGLEQGTSKENYDGNELLVSRNFLELFKKTDNSIKNFESYKKKYRRNIRNIKPFSNKQNKQNKQNKLNKIKKEAMPNLKEQKAGEPEPQSTEFKKNTKLYKENTLKKMPNQINYSCYKSITLGICHGMYMGVSYMNVLRLIGDKDPVKDYTLYKTKNEKIFSLPEDLESFKFNNKNCSLLKNRIKMKFGAKKKNSQNLSSSNPQSEQSNSLQSTSPQKAQSGFSCSIL